MANLNGLTDILFESAINGIILINDQGRIKNINLVALDFFSKQKEDCLGLPIQNFFPIISLPISEYSTISCPLLSKMKTTEIIDIRFDHSLAEQDIVVLFLEKKSPPNLVMVDSEKLKNRLFSSKIGQNMILADTNEKLEYTWIINSHPDFNEKKILGKRDDEIISNEGTIALSKLKQEVLEKNEPITKEILFQLSGKNQAWIIEASPLKNNKQEIIGVSTIAIESTDFFNSQQLLIEQTLLVEKVLSASLSSCYIMDLKAKKARFITESKDLLGVENIDVQTLDQLFSKLHPDDLDLTTEHISKILNDRDNKIFEFEIRASKDGKDWQWLKFRDQVFKRDKEGTPIEYLGSVSNVTQIKKAKLAEIEAILTGQENERSRIAADLHDSINSILMAAKINAESVLSLIDKTNSQHNLHAEKTISLVEHAMTGIKEIYSNISPNILVDFGLVKALKAYCNKIFSNNEININFDLHRKTEKLDFKIELALYRIGQEVLNNINKHAKATEVELQLIEHQKNITMMIIDNGIGFDLNSNKLKTNGYGFRNIDSRVLSLQGKFNIDSSLQKGTIITIELPV